MDGFENALPSYGYYSVAGDTQISTFNTEWEFVRYTEQSDFFTRAYCGVSTDFRSGAYAMKFGDWHTTQYGAFNLRCYARRIFEESEEIFFRVYMKLLNSLGTDADMISITDFNDNPLLRVRIVKSTRQFQVYNQAGTLMFTSDPITANVWTKIEGRIKANTTGIIEFWIDGTLVGTFNGNTKGTRGNPRKILIGSNISNTSNQGGLFEVLFDDVAVNNTTGTVNNGRCGSGKIIALAPKANGSTNDFVPSTGSNWQNVDETPTDGDTTYNESETTEDKDLYTFQKLVADKGIPSTDTVVAVSCEISGKWIGDVADIAFVVKETGEAETAKIRLSSNYAMQSFVMDENIEKDDIWTIADIDNSEFGIVHKVV